MDAKDRIIAKLKSEIAALKVQLQAAHDTIAQLQGVIVERDEQIAKLEKNSQTSHKPPSTDIVKPKKKRAKSKRKIGAQKGHKQHLRKPFPPERIDTNIDLHCDFDACPTCRTQLEPSSEPPKITQHVEIPVTLIHVTQFLQHMKWCPTCKCNHFHELPPEVIAGGLFGPNLTATIGYLKGRCHLSYTSVQDVCADVFGVEVSRGFLVKVVSKVSDSLADPHKEIEQLLPHEEHLKIDETGLKRNGVMQWVWVIVAASFVYFCVHAKRASAVLFEKLTANFCGTITSDFHRLYQKFDRESKAWFQFCWAHLIRDIKYLLTIDETFDYGNRILKRVKAMFETIRDKDQYSQQEYLELMAEHERKILAAFEYDVPDHDSAIAMENRLDTYAAEYFRFVELNLDPTNNESEQLLRMLIVDRVVTQGTRSEMGDRWNERFWTAYGTCRKQNRNVMEYLRKCVSAFFRGEASPSLLAKKPSDSSK